MDSLRDEPFDPDIDGPSNAEVLCVGIAAPGTVRVLVCAELGWLGYQVASQLLTGASFDPPPFPILARVNAVLVALLVLVALRARRDRRLRDEARRARERRRQERVDAAHAVILEALRGEYRVTAPDSLH